LGSLEHCMGHQQSLCLNYSYRLHCDSQLLIEGGSWPTAACTFLVIS
jgi:hypothetical protein